ncbi:hypothetical protein Q3G72_027096 [Acer saccharum]|nr:hypothetical protein Q3G72_027096 [Acer saccharum]
MEDVFMFSAQSEQGKARVVKEKPLDLITHSNRARAANDEDDSNLRNPSGDSFKSKLLGDVNRKENEGALVMKSGPTKSNFGGKNFGITAYSGKAGNGLKSGGGSSSHGANMIGKGTDSRKMVDKAHVALTGRRVVQTSKNGNSCNISSGGSRFAILFEEGSEERFAKKALSPSLERGKGVSNSVLSEISNLVPSRKKYLPPLPNKCYVIYDCSSTSDVGCSDGNSDKDMVGVSKLDLQVDISVVQDLVEVVSKLREAMEITLE